MLLLNKAIEVLLPELCSSLECVNTEVKPDSLGFLWCQDCSERRYIIEWGKAHHWPALFYGNYALEEGMEFWCTTALLGDDERVCALLAVIEELSRQEEF